MHRKKSHRNARPTLEVQTTRATEYKCGCVMHPVAGRIRQCGAFGARSLSGRFIKLETDIGKHAAGEVVRHYPVAAILP